MTLDELYQKKETIEKQITDLRKQLNLTINSIAAYHEKEILNLMRGTKWFSPSRFSSILTLNITDEKSKEVQEYVNKRLNIHPHGQVYITDSIYIQCDDNDICLGTDFVPDDPSENAVIYLVPFVKEYGLIIDFSDSFLELKRREENINEQKKNLDNLIKAFS